MKVNIGELGIRDIYSYYKSTIPNPLNYKDFRAITSEYLEQIMNEIIYQGATFTLPVRLGNFRVRKTKINFNKLSIDWAKTKELGFRVYHLNDHSDGYRVKFLWEKKGVILKAHSKRPYSFRLSREWKGKLAKLMREPQGHSIYPEELPKN